MVIDGIGEVIGLNEDVSFCTIRPLTKPVMLRLNSFFA